MSQHRCVAFDYIEHADKLDHYTGHIQKLCGSEPVVLVGYSAGGNLAFEVAKQLEQTGISLKKLLIIDSDRKYAQNDYSSKLQEKETEDFYQFLNRIGFVEQIRKNDTHHNHTIDVIVKNHISSYLAYIRNVNNNGAICADIAILACADNLKKYIEQWRTATLANIGGWAPGHIA